jgi:hypothetical protein
MKLAGYIFLAIGALGTILGFIGIATEQKGANLTGLGPLVLGAFLLSQANKKEEEKRKKKNWEDDNSKK